MLANGALKSGKSTVFKRVGACPPPPIPTPLARCDRKAKKVEMSDILDFNNEPCISTHVWYDSQWRLFSIICEQE